LGLEAGQLDIACLPTLAVAPLAPLVGAFRERHPQVLVALAAPEDTEELLNIVRSGRSEIGIVEKVSAPGLVLTDLGSQDFLVVLPPGPRRRAEIALSEIATMPIIVPPPSTSTRRLLEEAFNDAGLVPRIGVETTQREAILPLILAGAGVGLLPRPLAELAKALGCVVAEPSPPVRRGVALIHREGPLTPAAQAFLALAVQHAELDHPKRSKRILIVRDDSRENAPTQR
jgi:DNA-binding transcriptional LysR family regulator